MQWNEEGLPVAGSAIDQEAQQAAAQRWDTIAKPLGGLGDLEPMIARLAGIQGTPRLKLGEKAVVVFCADNGVVAQGVTQTSQETTAIVAENLTRSATSVCCMARCAGARVVPVDMGVVRPVAGPGLRSHRLGNGTADFTAGPAMSREQTVDGLRYGIQLAGQLKEEGVTLLATGEMGIGNTTTSSALISVLLQVDPQQVTGRGAGLSSAGLERKIAAIRQGIALNRPDPADPVDVLAKVGGFDLAGMAGLCLGGLVHRVPVVLDGLISTAAALVAVKLCPDVRQVLFASHVSREPAGQMVLDALGLSPLLTCGMCLGEGTGAVASFPLWDMALAVYDGMPTFQEIAVEQYQHLK